MHTHSEVHIIIHARLKRRQHAYAKCVNTQKWKATRWPLERMQTKRPTLARLVDEHTLMHARTNTHSHTNQYAEPEPLRSLITASFTAAGFNAFIFYFSLPLKFTEKWLSEESNLFRSLWKAASAINLIRDMLYFNEKTQPVLQFLHILLHHIDTSH